MMELLFATKSKAMTKIEKLTKLLCDHTASLEENELLVKCLPSIPNNFISFVQLGFDGWNVRLYPDGTWKVEDTGGCLKEKK
jgi:hypothetical protein